MICRYCKHNSGSMCSNIESAHCAKPIRRHSDKCDDFEQENFGLKRNDDVPLCELPKKEL